MSGPGGDAERALEMARAVEKAREELFNGIPDDSLDTRSQIYRALLASHAALERARAVTKRYSDLLEDVQLDGCGAFNASLDEYCGECLSCRARAALTDT